MFKYLRRFGLEHCDLPTMIENIAFLLRILTVNVERKHSQCIPTIFYVITIVTATSYFYVYVFSGLWFVLVRCQETGDLVAASVVFSLAACSLPGISKLVFMRFHRDTVMNIVEEYLACDALVERDSRFSTTLHKGLRYVKRRAVAFWVFIVFNAISYVGIPIMLSGRHFVEDYCVIYGLEPMFETPNYEIAFTLMTAGIYFAISAEINTSSFITILAGYTEAQMLALSEELNNLWEDANVSALVLEEIRIKAKSNRDKTINKCIQNQLTDIVKKHKVIINLVGQVESLFRGAMTIEFGWVTSALIAELLGGLKSTYMQLPSTLIQVTMDCFIGQRLIDASFVLENAIYNCKWENFHISNQRIVFFMLLNSQKTLKLSAGGVTVLCFSSLMYVLKTIYSAYTTLRSRI